MAQNITNAHQQNQNIMMTQGTLHDNYCYGPDKIAGNEDDCGCAEGQEIEEAFRKI